jgi:hypothetical protein
MSRAGARASTASELVELQSHPLSAPVLSAGLRDGHGNGPDRSRPLRHCHGEFRLAGKVSLARHHVHGHKRDAELLLPCGVELRKVRRLTQEAQAIEASRRIERIATGFLRPTVSIYTVMRARFLPGVSSVCLCPAGTWPRSRQVICPTHMRVTLTDFSRPDVESSLVSLWSWGGVNGRQQVSDRRGSVGALPW